MDRMNEDRLDEGLPPALDAALRTLDARAAGQAARVDVDRVATRVLDRLLHGDVERPWRLLGMSPAALRAAAAVIVVAAAGLVVHAADQARPAEALHLPAVMPAMDSLSAGQLEVLLDATAQLQPVADTTAPAATNASLDDLTEAQLQTLLASLEGAES